MPVDGKTVLEIGCGPGGNLALFQHRAAKLYGVDVSPVMVELSTRRNPAATVQQIDGRYLPFADASIDVAYTSTVLQHNVEWAGCSALLNEISRVTKERIVLIEDVGHEGHDGTDTWVGRRMNVYVDALARLGWSLTSSRFLNLAVSRRAHYKSRRLWPAGHSEGQPVGWKASAFLNLALVFTRFADRFRPGETGLAQMVFVRRSE
jgi:SAM-dependent methyltransferase